MNITEVGFKSFFPQKLLATNRAFLFDSCLLFLHRVNSHHYLYQHQNCSIDLFIVPSTILDLQPRACQNKAGVDLC